MLIPALEIIETVLFFINAIALWMTGYHHISIIAPMFTCKLVQIVRKMGSKLDL